MRTHFQVFLNRVVQVLPTLLEFFLYIRLWNLAWACAFLALSIVPAKFEWSHSWRFNFFLLVAESLLLSMESYTELLLASFRIGMVTFVRYVVCSSIHYYEHLMQVHYTELRDMFHQPLYRALFRDTTSPSTQSIQTAIRALDIRISQYSFGPPQPVEEVLEFIKQKEKGLFVYDATFIRLQMTQLTQLLEMFVYIVKLPLYEEGVGGIPLPKFQTNYLENGLVAEYMRMSVWDSYVDRMNWTPILETLWIYLENTVEVLQRDTEAPVKETYEAFKPILERYLSDEEELQRSLAKITLRSRMDPLKEELIAAAWHPTRVELETV